MLGAFVGVMVAYVAPPVRAVDVDLYGEASVKVMSSYIWRGRTVNAREAYQPELTLTADPVSLNVWGNWDIKGEEASSERTRIDTSLDYTFSVKQVELKAGLVVHAYHDAPSGRAKDTYEVYLDASTEIAFYPHLYPSVIVYYDFGTIEGVYGALSVMYAWPLSESTDALVRLMFGAGSSKFNNAFFSVLDPAEGEAEINVKKDTPIHMTLSASVPFKVGNSFRIIPQVDYVKIIDSDLRAAVEANGNKPENTVLSIAGSWEF